VRQSYATYTVVTPPTDLANFDQPRWRRRSLSLILLSATVSPVLRTSTTDRPPSSSGTARPFPPRFSPFGNPLSRTPFQDKEFAKGGKPRGDTARRASGVARETGTPSPFLRCPTIARPLRLSPVSACILAAARFLLPNTRPHPILRPLFQETDYASDNRTESDTQHRDHGAH
jgi:hypothetical protein